MKTKRLFTLLVSMFVLGISVCCGQELINMQHIGNHNDHFNIPVPADMPDVYYNNSTQTVIIDGGGEVNYYDVEIISLTSMNTVISTQVNGYYDTIDVSSLPEAEYGIFIYSPTGNSFEGFFEIY